MMMDHMDKMYFHFSAIGDTILFEGWRPESDGHYVLSLLAVFLLCLAKEWTFAWRKHVVRELRSGWNRDERVSLLNSKTTRPLPAWIRAVDSSLYTLNLTLGYLVMLVVMTFNVGLCITVVLSCGLGHFLFATGPFSLCGSPSQASVSNSGKPQVRTGATGLVAAPTDNAGSSGNSSGSHESDEFEFAQDCCDVADVEDR